VRVRAWDPLQQTFKLSNAQRAKKKGKKITQGKRKRPIIGHDFGFRVFMPISQTGRCDLGDWEMWNWVGFFGGLRLRLVLYDPCGENMNKVFGAFDEAACRRPP